MSNKPKFKIGDRVMSTKSLYKDWLPGPNQLPVGVTGVVVEVRDIPIHSYERGYWYTVEWEGLEMIDGCFRPWQNTYYGRNLQRAISEKLDLI